MGHRRLGLLAIALSFAAFAACSGSKTTSDGGDTTDPTTSADKGSAPPPGTTGSTDEVPRDDLEGGVRADRDGGQEAGQGTGVTDAGPDAAASAECPSNGVSETEPNDSKAQASPLDPTRPFCGVLGDTGDVRDHLKVAMPAGKKEFRFTLTSDRVFPATVSGSVEGTTGYVLLQWPRDADAGDGGEDEDGGAIYRTGPDVRVKYVGSFSFK